MGQARMVETMQALRHVPGVYGSFLWMDDGKLLAVDLASNRPPAVLQMATRKLAAVAAAYASAGECLEDITLAYDKYQLHISGLANASLVVVLTRACSLHTVVPVIDAVLRDLGRMPELSAATQAQLRAADQPPAPPGRSYRGGRILE
jgi:hypothetical protein